MASWWLKSWISILYWNCLKKQTIIVSIQAITNFFYFACWTIILEKRTQNLPNEKNPNFFGKNLILRLDFHIYTDYKAIDHWFDAYFQRTVSTFNPSNYRKPHYFLKIHHEKREKAIKI